MSAEVKTPEQIATEALNNWYNMPDTNDSDLIDRIAMESSSGSGSLLDIITAAVEADRAQRSVAPHSALLPGKIAKRVARGVKGRWLRMGYTKGEASDVADEAKAAAMRALKEVGL